MNPLCNAAPSHHALTTPPALGNGYGRQSRTEGGTSTPSLSLSHANLLLTLAALLGAAGPATVQAATSTAYAYSAALTVTMPTGSAGAVPAKTQPSATKFSPCASTGADQITVSLKYDAGKTSTDKRDLYVLFHRPEAAGTTTEPKFFTITKGNPITPTIINLRINTTALNTSKATDPYIAAADNLGGAITESILGGNVRLEGLMTGTWQVVAIIADKTTVDFDDPATWLAWDVANFVTMKPWLGGANMACN